MKRKRIKKEIAEKKAKPVEDKKAEKQKKKEVKELDKKIEPLLIEKIMPVVDFEETGNYGIMFDGSIIDMFRIRSKDIYAADKNEILMDQILWDRLYKTYPEDLKIISFHFPTDTSRQQSYINTIATRTENPIYRKLLAEQKEKLIEIHQHYMDKEYILCFFSRNPPDHAEKVLQIKNCLSKASRPLIEPMSKDKKIRIIYKLYNKNMNIV